MDVTPSKAKLFPDSRTASSSGTGPFLSPTTWALTRVYLGLGKSMLILDYIDGRTNLESGSTTGGWSVILWHVEHLDNVKER